MQKDFHYFATYCAAFLAGYSTEESAKIAYSAQFVDCCTATLLQKVKAPVSAATTQSGAELINLRTNVTGMQDVTRIWSSFHFLPKDLYAEVSHGSKIYKHKYRLICGPNGDLVEKTVKLAQGKGLEAAGIAMHVLADTWAHRNFAGTTSQVINDINFEVSEILNINGVDSERVLKFRHSTVPDDLQKGIFTNSVNDSTENSIMILGHGRAGHLPDYSFINYKYMPAWNRYEIVVKDNPKEYMLAFRQMVTALKYMRGETNDFHCGAYDCISVEPWAEKIDTVLRKRQLDACDDWAALGKVISGSELEPFDLDKWQREYISAAGEAKDESSLGQFVLAAMRQKSMVTREIFVSGSLLAGYSADYEKSGFKGIRDFRKLIDAGKEK